MREKRTRFTGLIALVVAMMLVGAGGAFAATYYANMDGTADVNFNLASNYFTVTNGGGIVCAGFAEGDILVFDANSEVGALAMTTSANMTVGVTVKIDAAPGAVSITPGHTVLLSGIDMSTAGATFTINNGAGSVALSGIASFITKAGQALSIAEGLANGGFLLTISGDGTPSFTGGISGTGGLTLGMAANEAVTINTVAADYSGTTTITSGYLTAGAANMISDNSEISIANAANARLVLAGAETIKSLSGGGGAGGNIVNGGGLLTINQTSAGTYTGIISGAGGLTKTGAQTLKLAGVNTYTGVTTVSAGTLLINAVQANANDGGLIVQNTATLGGTGTIKSDVTVQTGGIVKPGDGGAGTLTVAASGGVSTGKILFNDGSYLTLDNVNAAKDVLAATILDFQSNNNAYITLEAGYSFTVSNAVVTAATYNNAEVFKTTSLPAGWGITSTNNVGVSLTYTNPIPTLNEWGIIIMMLLLAGASIVFIRRRRPGMAA